jgi:RNA polymerase sigma-70 factor (ECF subfamily)
MLVKNSNQKKSQQNQPFSRYLHHIRLNYLFLSEEELIKACVEGNQRACRELYELHKNWLYAICLRYHQNQSDAQDSLQESFILIYKNLSSFEGKGSLKGWMRMITVRCILASFRKKKKMAETDLGNIQDPVNLDFLQDLDLDELKFLIDKLPPGRKHVFLAHAVDGFSHKEIAEMLNVSEGTSKSQFFHARRELRQALENNIVIAKKIQHER